MYSGYKKILFILSIIVITLTIIFLIKDYEYKRKKNEEKPYTSFISLIKSGDYLKAYTDLYPLILKHDVQAMELIGDAYNEGYGIEIDLIKAKMWYEKSQNMGRDGGELEYNQAIFFLKINDSGMATEFLQKSAERGCRDAIEKIKDEEFIKLNKLNINPNWKKYWGRFKFEELYPYSNKIERSNQNLLK